jgi:hypothetical protein
LKCSTIRANAYSSCRETKIDFSEHFSQLGLSGDPLSDGRHIFVHIGTGGAVEEFLLRYFSLGLEK